MTDRMKPFRFTPQVIDTEQELLSWLKITFPLFTNDDLAKVLLYYPSTNASVSASNPQFAITGDNGPTAVNQSDAGTGTEPSLLSSPTADETSEQGSNSAPITFTQKQPLCVLPIGWLKLIVTTAGLPTNVSGPSRFTFVRRTTTIARKGSTALPTHSEIITSSLTEGHPQISILSLLHSTAPT